MTAPRHAAHLALIDICQSKCGVSDGEYLVYFPPPRLSWYPFSKINSPYKGTLSSYGYVLLVIFFLVHVKNPPVLPNLQQMPPLRPMSKVRHTDPNPI